MSEQYSVRAAEGAASHLRELKARAEAAPDKAHARLWRSLHQAIEQLKEPGFALNRGNQLRNDHRSYDLRNVCRIKIGRGRLFYLVSSEKRQVIVLFFGDTRRAGDKKRDAYAEFARRLRHGEFDTVFRELGVTKPAG